MGVGMRIKSILRDRKLTIKQLAERTNIPVNTLYSITKRDSKRVDAIILQRIADCLGVPTDDLIDDETTVVVPAGENFNESMGGSAKATSLDDTAITDFFKALSKLSRSDWERINAIVERLEKEQLPPMKLIGRIAPESTPATPEGQSPTQVPDVPEKPTEGK